MKVTVVIPCYNEERTIKNILERCKPFCDEIIVVVSKNSTDKTAKIASSVKGVKTIFDNGKGKGEALRLAFNMINDGVIVTIDADDSHTPEDIPKIVEPIKQNKADMVIASRILGGSEELSGDFEKTLRLFFSNRIADVINWRFNVSIKDTQNGFRAIKAEIVKELNLKSDIFDIETEMVMKCLKNKYRILEVPSKELKRKYGLSGISLRKHGIIYIFTVLKNLF
jgi:dolichol-phosphate mannosyltransferase